MLFQKSQIRKKINQLFVLIIIFQLTNPTYGFRSQFIIASNPFEEKLFTNFDSMSDIESALTASGIEPEYYSLYTSEILRWKNEIESNLPPNATEKQIAQLIGYYLHDKVFTKYRIEATTLKDIFETGYFNCLSATILVNILLRAFGINTQAVVLPTHVYTLALLDGKNIEIENTIKEGLSISENKASQERFNQLTGFQYNSSQNKKIIISWKESVGLLYSNRSYFNGKKKDYETAFQNMMKAQALLHTAPSEQNNLISGYLNYSYFTYKNKNSTLQQYLKTLSVLEEGMHRYPNYYNLKGNYLKGLDIILEKMILLDASSEDINLLLESAKKYLGASDFRKIQKSRYIRAILYYLRTNNDYRKAKENITQLWLINPKDKDIREIIQEYSFSRIQNELSNMDINMITQNTEIINELSEFPLELTKGSLGCYYSGIARKYFEQSKFEDSVNIMSEAKQKIGSTQLIVQNGFVYAVNSAQYFVQNNNFNRALDFYKKALVFKKDQQVIENMGIIYEKLIADNIIKQNPQKAQRLLEEGLKLIPESPRLKILENQYSYRKLEQ